MSEMFPQIDRDTLFSLPPSMDDWLLEGYLARFVVEIVGKLDLMAITSSYAGHGSKEYHHEMFLPCCSMVTPLLCHWGVLQSQTGCLKLGKFGRDGTKDQIQCFKVPCFELEACLST